MTVEAGQELAIIDAEVTQVALRREPATVLAEAKKAAVALRDVISQKAKKIEFNGEQYLEFEDWQTLGRFYGITSKIVEGSTQFVEYGVIKGFTSRAVTLFLSPNGPIEISAADADCLDDEPKWKSKTKYEWRDKAGGGGRERVAIGEEPVPLFQLKSMAQTRAQAKSLRNVLSFVAVLAGYRPTPAEEMTGEENSDRHTTKATSSGASSSTSSAATTPATPPNADGSVMVKSVKRGTPAEGQKKAKPGWVGFSDGKEYSTFDDKVLDLAEEAKQHNWHVQRKLDEKTSGQRTFVNLVGLERVVVVQTQAADIEPDDEPVGGPEKVLSVSPRSGTNQQGEVVKVTMIQTDRRQYTTQNKDWVALAETAKTSSPKGKLIVAFERIITKSGVVNKVTDLKAAPVSE